MRIDERLKDERSLNKIFRSSKYWIVIIDASRQEYPIDWMVSDIISREDKTVRYDIDGRKFGKTRF